MNVLEILSRENRKLIEKRFFYRDKILKAVELEREKLIKANGGTHENIGASPTNRTSDPVGWRGMQLADIPSVTIEIEITPGQKKAEYIEWPERWLKVIDRTNSKFASGPCPLAMDLIEWRYRRQRNPDNICSEIGIDKRTYYIWLEGIINFAGMVAAELHIIKII